MKEQNRPIFFIEDTLKDNTDKKNEKIVFQLTMIEKGKDLSEKLDEYILELKKNKSNNKIDFGDIRNKVFGENPGFGIEGYFSSYLSCLYNIYNSTAEGDGDGHKLITDGKLQAGDFSVENFKEIYKNRYSKGQNAVSFSVNNSFKNKPIIWSHQIFLSEDQYFQYRDEIMDFIKSEAGFKNLTSRETSISPYDYVYVDINSQKFPNNIKNSLSEDYVEKNMRSSFNIIYDTENINKDSNSYSKEDLKKVFEGGDFSIDKDVVNDESFSLRIGFDLRNDHDNDLPVSYYLSKNDKPIFKGNDKLAFKQKGDIVGSEYYISNTIIDRDQFIKRYRKMILSEYKDDEGFNKLTPKEQEALINESLESMIVYMDEAHKDDSTNIKKYQAFLNSEKWGNQRLTQYVGNVDTKTEEQDFKVIKKEDSTLAIGETKVVKKGVKGKKVTKITYKVNRVNGELTDPVSEIVEDTKPIDEVVLVGTKKVVPAKPIEDIAKTTKTTKETIKAKVSYEADDTLEFEKQNVVKKAVDGEKEVTTVSQKGKKDVVTEKVIKDKVDGLTKVGNKKVEVDTKDGVTTTTTTIYEVDKKAGKLINPKSTVKTILNAEKIEDIAKKVIPAEKIQDIAKKVMPTAKIEDIAKKTIPAKKIEDIATKVNKDNEKDTIKTTNSEPKKTAHLPKAGTSSEILTLAVGALATISGASLSKKRRK